MDGRENASGVRDDSTPMQHGRHARPNWRRVARWDWRRRRAAKNKLHRGLRAFGVMAITGLLAIPAALIPAPAALANTTGAISLIANGPTSQVVSSAFQTTVSWSCSGGQGTACDDVVIQVPITLDAPAGAVEEMDLWGISVTLPPTSVAGFTQNITRTANSATVTLRATSPIPAGTQENFVITVRPHGATGDGVGFTAGQAELASSAFPTVTSDAVEYTVTARDLLEPQKLFLGAGPGSAPGAMVATYQITPNVRGVWDPNANTWTSCVAQLSAHTNQHDTVVAGTLQIIDTLPAGATFLSATGGGVYDAASHTVTWTSCTNLTELPYILRIEMPAVTDQTDPDYREDITNTLERRFIDTAGVEQSTTASAVHSNLLVERQGALISKCGAGRFALPVGTPNPGGHCAPFRASVPYGYSGTSGNALATHFYTMSASRLIDGDVVTFTDWLPCFSNPVNGAVVETFESQVNCTDPSAGFYNIAAQRVPTTGSATSIGLQRLVLHLSDGTSEVYDGTTRPIPSLSSLPQFPGLVIAGFEATTQPMSGSGRISLTAEARLQPGANREMYLNNTVDIRVENPVINYVFTGETSGTGVVRDMVGASTFIQFTGSSANRQLLSSMTVYSLDPNVAVPNYTMVLPPGYEPRNGDMSTLVLNSPAPQVTNSSHYTVNYIPEDLNAGIPGRIVITPLLGTPAVPATVDDAWPFISARITIDPTYAAPYGPVNADAFTTMNGDAIQIGGCVYGSYLANDPNDVDADGLTTDDSSCAWRAGTTFQPTNIVPTSVLTKLVRDPQSPDWSGGNQSVVSTSGAAEYLLRWENGGLPTLSNVVLYDLLPTPGDTGALTGNAVSPRGSAFQPTFTGVVSQSTVNNVVVSYSASQNPCRPEVFPTNPGCVNDWTTDPATFGGTDQVRALRVQLNGDWAGGSSFTLRFGVDLPPNTASSAIAWNTLAGRALVGADPLVAAESARVGVRAPSNVTVTKTSPEEDTTIMAGDTLEYTITATNQLDARADDVLLVDDLSEVLQVASYVNAIATINGVESGTVRFDPLSQELTWEGSLGAQETVEILLTMQVNDASAHSGVTNTVIGTVGDDPTNCVEGTEPECSVTVTTVDPRIQIDKFSADVHEGDTLMAETTVNWTYRVTNPGAETVVDIAVTDSRGVAVTCPATELAPGASMDCMGTGSVGTASPYRNVGVVVGEGDYSGFAVTDSDEWAVNVRMPDPAIQLDKTSTNIAEGSTVDAETIADWTYSVTNTGEEPLVIVRVTDDQGVIVTCPVTELAVGESTTCTGSGSVGFGPSYTNVGLAEAVGSISGTPVSDSDPWSVNVTPYAVGLTIDKTAPGHVETGWVRPNTSIDWEYLVTNVGEEPVDTVAVTDDQGVVVTCPATVLAPGESMVCTGSGSVGAGPDYTNIGTVTGITTLTQTSLTDDDPWSITVREPVTAVEIVKGSTNAIERGTAPANHVVDWQYTVVNTGEEPLITLVVTDDQGVAVTCPTDTLAPNETMVCTGSGSIGTADRYQNLGTVIGLGELTGTQVSAEDPWWIRVEHPDAAVVIIKDAEGHGEGDILFPNTEMTWSYTVVNTGGQPLAGLTVVDDQGVAVTCPADTLEIGGSMVCTGTGSIGDGTSYTNVGTVTGHGTWNDAPVSAADPWETPIASPPALLSASPLPTVPSNPADPTPGLALTGSGLSALTIIGLSGVGLLTLGAILIFVRRRKSGAAMQQ